MYVDVYIINNCIKRVHISRRGKVNPLKSFYIGNVAARDVLRCNEKSTFCHVMPHHQARHMHHLHVIKILGGDGNIKNTPDDSI